MILRRGGRREARLISPRVAFVNVEPSRPWVLRPDTGVASVRDEIDAAALRQCAPTPAGVLLNERMRGGYGGTARRATSTRSRARGTYRCRVGYHPADYSARPAPQARWVLAAASATVDRRAWLHHPVRLKPDSTARKAAALGQLACFSSAASTRRSTLPTIVFGSSFLNSTFAGTL